MASTKEKENHIYMAKLAEQAERHDGLFLTHSLSQSLAIMIILCLVYEKKKMINRAFKLKVF